jgi:hypothetical protein
VIFGILFTRCTLNVVNFQYKMANVRDTETHAVVASLHWTYQMLSGDEVKRAQMAIPRQTVRLFGSGRT